MADQEFDKYKYLAHKTLYYMRSVLGISKDLEDDLLGIGYLTILEVLAKHPIETRDPKMQMDVYLIYRLKRKYARTVRKSGSYWPWAGDEPVMVGYDEVVCNYIEDPDPLPDEAMRLAELRADIDKAKEILTQHQREILELKYNKGLGVRDIGKIFGCSHQTVSMSDRAARAKMREGCPWLIKHLEGIKVDYVTSGV